MINVTKLLCGGEQPADHLRYGRGPHAPAAARDRKPVVVWNITRRCNLRCVHCYSNSDAREYPGELTLDECHTVIDDLADYGVPALLLSGGEPTIHPHFFDIAEYAASKGIRITVSTNGTLITPEIAARLKAINVTYVGISLDGIGETHDIFRGRSGAFERAVAGIRNCKAVGQKVGLRLTLTRQTAGQLPEILQLIEDEDIERVCFYHLVYSGRGAELAELDPVGTRACLRQIAEAVLRWNAAGRRREVLTVDQPADGPFFLMFAREKLPDRVDEIQRLLGWNGGGSHSSGTGIGNIDSQGCVHPDQFWQTCTLGNVRDRAFSEIWSDPLDPMLALLRDRLPHLKGRCASCRFLPLCGGGFRTRAFQRYGDALAEDPGCYLSDEEISCKIASNQPVSVLQVYLKCSQTL